MTDLFESFFYDLRPNSSLIFESLLRELQEDSDFFEQTTDTGKNPLHILARAGCAEGMRLAASLSVKFNVQDDSGNTPLHYALRSRTFDVANFLECIEIALQGGADPNIRNHEMKTSLLAFGPSSLFFLPKLKLQVIKILHSYGATLSVSDQYGNCAVHFAESAAELNYLVENGVGIDQKNHLGQTPLIFASRCSNWETSRRLISLGANVNDQDNQGYGAIHYAVAETCPKSFLNLLLEFSCDINMQSIYRQTPLHIAIISGNYSAIDIPQYRTKKAGSFRRLKGIVSS
jgi:uncharacterized protein